MLLLMRVETEDKRTLTFPCIGKSTLGVGESVVGKYDGSDVVGERVGFRVG